MARIKYYGKLKLKIIGKAASFAHNCTDHELGLDARKRLVLINIL